jgi:hypothetical protein
MTSEEVPEQAKTVMKLSQKNNQKKIKDTFNLFTTQRFKSQQFYTKIEIFNSQGYARINQTSTSNVVRDYLSSFEFSCDLFIVF